MGTLSSVASALPAIFRAVPTIMAALSGDRAAGIELAKFAITNPEVGNALSSVAQSSVGLLSSM